MKQVLSSAASGTACFAFSTSLYGDRERKRESVYGSYLELLIMPYFFPSLAKFFEVCQNSQIMGLNISCFKLFWKYPDTSLRGQTLQFRLLCYRKVHFKSQKN